MTLIQDLRYGARLLVKNPAFSGISVLTLALGIGLTTMMFSIVNGALLKGLPFEEADRLVHLSRNNLELDFSNMGVPLHDLGEWREQQQVFDGLGAYTTGTFNVSGTEMADRYDGAWMTANAFDILRARPIMGRTFREGEDAPGAEAVAVIGFRVWQDRYGGASDVLGRTIRINGEEATIIGVMDENFMFPISQLIWLPERRSALDYDRATAPQMSAFGRLRADVSIDRANLEMGVIADRIAQEHPEVNEGIGVEVAPFTDAFIGEEPRALLLTMLVAVFGVLLIACANVANLLLGQAALRAKEVGIRTALGASRIRVILQFLTEPLALAMMGAVFGLGIAWAGVALFNRAIADTNPPFWLDIGMDGTVLLFVVAITLFATLVSGVLPAIRASGGNVNEILKDDSRGASSFRGGRLTKTLVIFEIALSVTLLVAAGLMIKSVVNLGNIAYNFPTEDVFTARLGLPEADPRYAEDEARVRFFEEVEARIAAEPDVRSVTLTSGLPGRFGPGNRVALEGQVYDRPNDFPFTRAMVITPSFFETFEVDILEGAGFTAADRAGSLPVAIVNRSFADTHFPDGDVLGQRVRLGGPESELPWLTIVGIAPDMFHAGAQNEEPQAIYTPMAQSPGRFLSLAIRPTGDPMAVTPVVRAAIATVDADIPIYWVMTLAESAAEENWFYWIFGSIFMVLGFVALFLAAIGLYGVMAFSVSRRTREMGVRMALGAQRGDVVGLIMRQGLVQLGIGLLIGLGAAAGAANFVTMLLFEVNPRDPFIFISIVLVLTATGLVASWIPARRATRVDPNVALRYE